MVVAIVCVMAASCGGPANKYDSVVSGTITIDGELAPSGTVTFHPVAKDGKIAIGHIYPDGSFSLRTGQGDLKESDGGTVVPGEYIVTVVVNGPPEKGSTPEGGPPGAGPLLVAKRYISRETSDLRCQISAGDNVFSFDVERAEPDEADENQPDGATDDADAADATQSGEIAEPTGSQSTEGAEDASVNEGQALLETEPAPAPVEGASP
jgi:hypothetical protein